MMREIMIRVWKEEASVGDGSGAARAQVEKTRAYTVIDGVPYYGGGENARTALMHLCDCLRDHGAPVPGKLGTEVLIREVEALTLYDHLCKQGWLNVILSELRERLPALFGQRAGRPSEDKQP